MFYLYLSAMRKEIYPLGCSTARYLENSSMKVAFELMLTSNASKSEVLKYFLNFGRRATSMNSVIKCLAEK